MKDYMKEYEETLKIQEKLEQKVYDVLEAKYPGENDFERLQDVDRIGPGFTFERLLEDLNELDSHRGSINSYDTKERMYQELADIINVDYSIIVNKWGIEGHPEVKPNQEKDNAYIKNLIEIDPRHIGLGTIEQQNNKELGLAVIETCSYNVKYVGEELKNDKDFIKEVVKQDMSGLQFAIQYANPSFADNKEVVLEAVKAFAYNLSYASDRMKDDKEVVLAALNNERAGGHILLHASDRLRDDKEVIMTAVMKNPEALQYASDRLKDSEVVVKAAVDRHDENNPIQYASERIRNNPELLNESSKTQGKGFLDNMLNKCASMREDKQSDKGPKTPNRDDYTK